MSTASLARFSVFALPLLASVAAPVAAQEVTLNESFKPGHTTKVEMKLKGSGKVSLPPTEKDKPGRVVPMEGNSAIVFEERVLTPDEPGTLKTVRAYRDVAFEVTRGDIKLDATIRPSVRRMVVMKPAESKDSLPRPVPFSPDGPMTLGELELVSVDVFNPAMVPGLLPQGAVKPGASWKASATAVSELTNLEKVEEGAVTVEFVGVVRPNGKALARLRINGTVRGVDFRDGPMRHKLEGSAYFDLEAGLLTYVSMRGTKEMLDGKGQTGGVIEGQFTITRAAVAKVPADLSDASLRDLELKPSAENTLLLYDNTNLGIRFLYPRGWRIGTEQGNQLTLDHSQRGGLFITVEPPSRVPTPDDYLKEVIEGMKTLKATITNTEKSTRVRAEPVTLDCFALDVTIGAEKRRLEYTVLKQTDGGATISANLPADAADLRPEVVRIVRSLSVTKKIEERKVEEKK